jgi:drug/metabolite transporter (DMT)-like permease
MTPGDGSPAPPWAPGAGGRVMLRTTRPASIVALTAGALVCFAANSVLCRLALGPAIIDPYAFTAVRLAAGAVTLLALVGCTAGRLAHGSGSWRAAFFLVLYAVPFSLAYVRLGTGTGALLLFGAVQLTMIGLGLRGGERPHLMEWVGLLGAAAGLVYLVSPGLTAPDPLGAAFMVAAGIGWGFYSVVGRSAGDPIQATAGNFAKAALLVVPATALAYPWLTLSGEGALIAALSGSVASGLGYAVWYAALEHLTVTRSALVQLAVPVVAALGGIAFLHESISLRLVIASVVILGSIAIGIAARRRA